MIIIIVDDDDRRLRRRPPRPSGAPDYRRRRRRRRPSLAAGETRAAESNHIRSSKLGRASSVASPVTAAGGGISPPAARFGSPLVSCPAGGQDAVPAANGRAVSVASRVRISSLSRRRETP